MSNKFEPIPIPTEQKLREFRHRFLPIIIFLTVAFFVYYLWNQRVTEAGFSAKVVADSSLVTSPYDGTLEYYSVSPFDEVEKGDPVARIVRTDSSYMQARLDHIKALINQVEIGLDPYLNQQRNLLDYENIRLENIDYRIQIATLKVEVQQLKAEYERAKILVDKDGISRSEFDVIEREYRVAQTELDEKIVLNDELSSKLEDINDTIISGSASATINSAIDVYEKELKVVEEELMPRTIYAPISGKVTNMLKRDGEFVRAGEVLFGIDSMEPKYLIGYARPPFIVEPIPGLKVQVRTRRPDRSYFESEIIKVGAQIRAVERVLVRPGLNSENGLPVQIAISPTNDLKLFPGEIVDVVLEP